MSCALLSGASGEHGAPMDTAASIDDDDQPRASPATPPEFLNPRRRPLALAPDLREAVNGPH